MKLSSLRFSSYVKHVGTLLITSNFSFGNRDTICIRRRNARLFVPLKRNVVILPSTRPRKKKTLLAEQKSLDYLTGTLFRYGFILNLRVNCQQNHFPQLGPERFRAPEILFNPELIGQEYSGVHQVVVDSITRVDLDLRKSLFSNIVLSGGSTLCKGKCTTSK